MTIRTNPGGNGVGIGKYKYLHVIPINTKQDHTAGSLLWVVCGLGTVGIHAFYVGRFFKVVRAHYKVAAILWPKLNAARW